MFRQKDKACRQFHSPVAREQIWSVKNICKEWASHGCEDHIKQHYKDEDTWDRHGTLTVVRTLSKTEKITCTSCCGQWGTGNTAIHPGPAQFVVLSRHLHIDWDDDGLYFCNLLKQPLGNNVQEMQLRQVFLDHYTAKYQGQEMTIQRAFKRREDERFRLEKALFDKGYLQLIYPYAAEFPANGHSDKIWWHHTKALQEGALNLKGYPYGNGYGTMDVWNFLLEDGAIFISPRTDLPDVMIEFFPRLPYGPTLCQERRAAYRRAAAERQTAADRQAAAEPQAVAELLAAGVQAAGLQAAAEPRVVDDAMILEGQDEELLGELLDEDEQPTDPMEDEDVPPEDEESDE